MEANLVVSSSPHLRTPETVRSIMGDVLVALFPVALMSILLFGYHAVVTIVIAVLSAMVVEAVILRKSIVGDGSAAVTGLLLALTLPPGLPWWVIVIGSITAIGIGKQVFGGLGYNLFNPALVGRAVLMISWGSRLAGEVWVLPKPFAFFYNITTVTGATPLVSQEPSLLQLFIGQVSGSLGETSALALLVGAIWLFYKRHIDWRIPAGFLGTVFILGVLLGGGAYQGAFMTGLFHVLAGGVMIGALFMATDMVTSPVTPWGRLIFGVGCGLITMLIRFYGSLPEGVTFGILLMNGLTPLIDKLTQPRVFGEVKPR